MVLLEGLGAGGHCRWMLEGDIVGGSSGVRWGVAVGGGGGEVMRYRSQGSGIRITYPTERIVPGSLISIWR